MAEIVNLLSDRDKAEQMRREIEMLQNFIKTPGWVLYRQLVEQQITAIATQLIGPGVPDRAYVCGLVKGHDEAISLPEQVIRTYNTQTEVLRPADNPLGAKPGLLLDPNPNEDQ